jgi:hypothetical protein
LRTFLIKGLPFLKDRKMYQQEQQHIGGHVLSSAFTKATSNKADGLILQVGNESPIKRFVVVMIIFSFNLSLQLHHAFGQELAPSPKGGLPVGQRACLSPLLYKSSLC